MLMAPSSSAAWNAVQNISPTRAGSEPSSVISDGQAVLCIGAVALLLVAGRRLRRLGA